MFNDLPLKIPPFYTRCIFALYHYHKSKIKMKTHGCDTDVTLILTQMYKFACENANIPGNEMLSTLLCYKNLVKREWNLQGRTLAGYAAILALFDISMKLELLKALVNLILPFFPLYNFSAYLKNPFQRKIIFNLIYITYLIGKRAYCRCILKSFFNFIDLWCYLNSLEKKH